MPHNSNVRSVIDYIESRSDGSASVTLYFPNYRPGGILAVQGVSAWNDDSATSRIDVGVEREGMVLWLKSFTTVSAGTVVNYDNRIYVPTDYRVVVRFVGSTLNDHLHAVLAGYVRYPRE